MLRNLMHAAMLCASLVATGSLAEDYPSRPIRIIVPFPPGGGVDTIARILQPSLQASLGQPVVVDNRPGAASIIGTEAAAKSAADGYTLLLALNPHVVNASIYKSIPYHPMRDFAPISLVAVVPNILVVHPEVKAGTVQELVALAQAQPGRLNFASAGVGSPFHLAGELFNVMAGTKIVHVPYKGGPQATTDLLSGRVQVMFGNLFNVLPHLKSGRLRPLAVTSSRRLDVMSDLPTIAEAGVPGYEFVSWFGFLAPRGTPADTVQRLHGEIRKALDSPEVRAKITQQGAEIIGSDPQEFSAFLAKEMAKWPRVVKEAGLKQE
jgi:tripartite-type tricarboxylate transporter receptor subunit TctC